MHSEHLRLDISELDEGAFLYIPPLVMASEAESVKGLETYIYTVGDNHLGMYIIRESFPGLNHKICHEKFYCLFSIIAYLIRFH